jgi:putative lipoic acid-binding regulatory protein
MTHDELEHLLLAVAELTLASTENLNVVFKESVAGRYARLRDEIGDTDNEQVRSQLAQMKAAEKHALDVAAQLESQADAMRAMLDQLKGNSET